jgi:hypothetical protein
MEEGYKYFSKQVMKKMKDLHATEKRIKQLESDYFSHISPYVIILTTRETSSSGMTSGAVGAGTAKLTSRRYLPEGMLLASSRWSHQMIGDDWSQKSNQDNTHQTH